jgi:hypothetical protein
MLIDPPILPLIRAIEPGVEPCDDAARDAERAEGPGDARRLGYGTITRARARSRSSRCVMVARQEGTDGQMFGIGMPSPRP